MKTFNNIAEIVDFINLRIKNANPNNFFFDPSIVVEDSHGYGITIRPEKTGITEETSMIDIIETSCVYGSTVHAINGVIKHDVLDECTLSIRGCCHTINLKDMDEIFAFN